MGSVQTSYCVTVVLVLMDGLIRCRNTYCMHMELLHIARHFGGCVNSVIWQFGTKLSTCQFWISVLSAGCSAILNTHWYIASMHRKLQVHNSMVQVHGRTQISNWNLKLKLKLETLQLFYTSPMLALYTPM